MAAKDIASSLITAGAGLAGGLFSNASNRRVAREQMAFQREAATHGIRWRVADAKAAGLHPLYALGAPTFTPSPMAFGDQVGPSMAEAGQSLAQAVSRTDTADERLKKDLDLALLASQLGESDARRELYLSEAARHRAASQVTAPTGLGIQSELPEGQQPNPPGVGLFELEAPKVSSHKEGRPDISAGESPYMKEYWLTPTLPFMMPDTAGESPEEILSEMSIGAYVGLIRRNAEIYGEEWLKDFMRLRYLGENPTGKYPSIKNQPKPQGSYRAPSKASDAYDWLKKKFKEYGRKLP